MKNHESQPVTPYNSIQPNDEIDLVELFSALKKNIHIIIASIILITSLAIAYIFSSKPVYESSTIITQPKLSELHKIDQGIDLSELTPESELSRVHRALINQDFQHDFFLKNILNTPDENPKNNLAAFETFQNTLTIKKSNIKKNNHDFIEIKIQAHNAKTAKELLANYISTANNLALKNSAEEYQAKIRGKIAKTEFEINEKLDIAKKSTTAQILRLEEAAKTARLLNIESGSSNGSYNYNITSELTIHSLPLYTLGYKALEARIELLKMREDMSPFVPELSELQAKLNSLKKIKIQNKEINLYTYEKTPFTPHKPIKPRKALIIATSIILGAVIGCFIALIRYFTNKKQ